MIYLLHFNDSLLLKNPTTTLEVVGAGKEICLHKVYHSNTRLKLVIDAEVYTFECRPSLEILNNLLKVKFNRQQRREIRKFLTLC